MEEARKKRDKEKQSSKNRNPLNDMSYDIEDELEELVEEGMI